MINYFNFKKFGNDYLVTNDLGNHMFLSESDFGNLVMDRITADNERYDEFTDKGFCFLGSMEVFREKFCCDMRESKNYLFASTSLHIFVVTNICNMKCVYCQAQSKQGGKKGMMTKETAQKTVNIALSSPGNYLTFEFQGGEPLINYEVIKFIVEYAQERKGRKNIEYNVVSNLTLLTEEMIDFFACNNVRLSASLDGNERVHNINRPFLKGGGTFEEVSEKLTVIRSKGISSGAVQTTTRYSLNAYKEIIDSYISNGMTGIFLRPLTPLGFANEHWEKIGYTTDEFLLFYKKSIEYLLELNVGGTYCSEGHAAIFLKKILGHSPVNYMELRSPCGAGIGQMAYYYDGNIFTCDEGRMLYEMGNDAFKLGTVDSSYKELIDNPVCQAACSASVLETVQGCCDCVYQPFCGTCPVINLAMENNIFPHTPKGYKCRIYGGMLDILFDIIKQNNRAQMAALESWI